MYTEIKAKIQALDSKVDDVIRKAASDGRILYSFEQRLVDDLRAESEKLSMELPLSALTVPKNSSFGGSRSAGNVTGGFRSFGEQLQSVMRAGIPGGQTDQRLYNAAASGLNETVPSDGGFLVQSDFSTALLQGVYETGLVSSRVNRIQISGNANSITLPAVDETSRATGSRWGGVQTYWQGEADEATKSRPKFRKLELNLKKVIGLCYATDELMADATALETIVMQAFTDEIGFVLDDSIIRGTGAGQPLGILNSGALVSVAAEAGQGKTVLFENILKMYSRMPGRNRKNAVWYVNQDVEPQLYSMSLAVGTGGGPCFLPGGNASGSPFSTLFGRPVVPIEQCSTLGDAGDVIFMDPTAYILAEKGGIQTAMSIHVRFLYDESVFRFVYRCDGQPIFSAPIVQYKGANPLSPFVTLAARS